MFLFFDGYVYYLSSRDSIRSYRFLAHVGVNGDDQIHWPALKAAGVGLWLKVRRFCGSSVRVCVLCMLLSCVCLCCKVVEQ